LRESFDELAEEEKHGVSLQPPASMALSAPEAFHWLGRRESNLRSPD